MEFYNIVDQTPYSITLSRPKNLEELSDLFASQEEIEEMIGKHFYMYTSEKPQTFLMKNEIKKKLEEIASKLDSSKAKTIPIGDEELVDVLKDGNYISDYIDSSYGRHGDRLCYAKRYKKKKTRATQTDVKDLWSFMFIGFHKKYGCYPTHIPYYDRGLNMFKAFKDIVGWKRTRRAMHKENVKFYRQIWDNPQEFIS